MSYPKTLRDLVYSGWNTKPPSREPENRLSAIEVDSNFLALQEELNSAVDYSEDLANAVLDEVLKDRFTARRTTGSTTLGLADHNRTIVVANSSSRSVSVPTHSSVAIPVGSRIHICREGTGAVTISANSGVTVNSPGLMSLRAQYSTALLIKVSGDEWYLSGDITMPV